MQLIKRLLAFLAILVLAFGGGLLIFGTMLPPEWNVRRSIDIAAPPSRVFPVVADFNNWARWSPWQKTDPGMKVAIPGASSGVGAKQTWESGDGKTTGVTEITGVVRNLEVDTKVSMRGDWESEFDCRMMLQRITGEGTELIWTCGSKEKKFVSKLLAHLMFDQFMGPDFEEGLKSIKAAAEAAPTAP